MLQIVPILLISVVYAGTTIQKMEVPNLIVEDLTSTAESVFMTNQTVQIQFPSLFTAFEGKVYDRLEPLNQTDISKDFLQNPHLYQQSTKCDFQPSSFQLEIQSENITLSNQKAISHAVDWENQHAYILTEDFRILKIQGDSEQELIFNKDSDIKQIGKLDVNNSIGGIFINQSNKDVYVFSKNKLFIWHNSQFVEVKGYSETEFGWDFIIKGSQLFILHSYNSIRIYRFSSFDNCEFVSTINSWAQKNISPVDLKFINNQLWVLDSNFGFYTYTTDSQKPIPKDSYPIIYGKKLFFEVNKNVTFEIVFQLNGDTYVAQMILSKDSLSLNRFYDQINGVKQLLFMEQRLVIIGEQEALSIQHSTNSALLTSSWQDKSFYSIIGLLDIQKSNVVNSKQGVLFTILKSKSLQVVSYIRNYATVTCYLQSQNEDSSHTIFIQINSTLCKKNSRVNMSSSYCSIRYNMNYRIVSVVSQLMNLLFTVSIVFLACGLLFYMMVSTKNMRKRKYNEIMELESELRKRMQNQKNRKQASQQVFGNQV